MTIPASTKRYSVHYNPYAQTLGGLGWKCWATGYNLKEARAKVKELRRDMANGTPLEIRPY